MNAVIGLASLIVILLILDRDFLRVDKRIDDHLRDSPHRKSLTKMLRSMGASKDDDLVDHLITPRNRLWSRAPIWVIIAMRVIGWLFRL